MMSFKGFPVVMALSVTLAGCTSMSVFKENEASAPVDKPDLAQRQAKPSLAPEADLDSVEPTQATGLAAAKIRSAVAGKSFRWQGPNNSGTTLFAQDGNSLIEVDGKGTTQGKWVARDGQLCESVNPGPILPKGSPLKCNTFSGTNGRYKVGAATFTPS
jgi:hypothetical protein